MEYSFIKLPDEILIIILKKLNNCDVLYSLIGVKKRLDSIVNNSIFAKSLTLTTHCNSLSYQFNDRIPDRFCLEILPKINDKIERLHVESKSMELILPATNYPHLHALGIYDLAPEGQPK
jgi:hypothetical protein